MHIPILSGQKIQRFLRLDVVYGRWYRLFLQLTGNNPSNPAKKYERTNFQRPACSWFLDLEDFLEDGDHHIDLGPHHHRQIVLRRHLHVDHVGHEQVLLAHVLLACLFHPYHEQHRRHHDDRQIPQSRILLWLRLHEAGHSLWKIFPHPFLDNCLGYSRCKLVVHLAYWDFQLNKIQNETD